VQRPYTRLILALTIAFSSWSCAAATAASAHRLAVAEARAGHDEVAVSMLRELTQAHPSERAYRYDLVAVLSWANRHAEANAAALPLQANAALPEYVLAAMARSAREVGELPRSEAAYQALARRKPNDADVQLGWALTLLAAQRPDAADARLSRCLRLAAKNPKVLRDAQSALLARGEMTRALPFEERLRQRTRLRGRCSLRAQRRSSDSAPR
jgi:biofilm PGA synthesis protein PgaA